MHAYGIQHRSNGYTFLTKHSTNERHKLLRSVTGEGQTTTELKILCSYRRSVAAAAADPSSHHHLRLGLANTAERLQSLFLLHHLYRNETNEFNTRVTTPEPGRYQVQPATYRLIYSLLRMLCLYLTARLSCPGLVSPHHLFDFDSLQLYTQPQTIPVHSHGVHCVDQPPPPWPEKKHKFRGRSAGKTDEDLHPSLTLTLLRVDRFDLFRPYN